MFNPPSNQIISNLRAQVRLIINHNTERNDMLADGTPIPASGPKEDIGVYVKVPVLAYNLLGHLRQYRAQRLLVGLCSYMDNETQLCWPSYTKLAKRVGMSKNSIRASLNILEQLGFIKISKKATGGKRPSNQYLIKRYAYRPDLWNWETASFLPKVGKCLDCGNYVNFAQYETGPRNNHVHFGCGGRVVLFTKPIPPDAPTFNQPPA